jgi:hypothetical protein
MHLLTEFGYFQLYYRKYMSAIKHELRHKSGKITRLEMRVLAIRALVCNVSIDAQNCSDNTVC